jgi:hypothetical protein
MSQEIEKKVEEPFFKTEREYQDALIVIYGEWRKRESVEACTDFDVWKIREIMRLRAEIDKVWLERKALEVSE